MHAEHDKQHWASYGHVLSVRLRKIRNLRGFSQEELAELSGVSRNSISNLERNENNNGQAVDPRLSTVYSLAKALNVPPAVLMPAAGENVRPICVDESLAVDIRWPTAEDKVVFETLSPATVDRELPQAAQ